MTEVWQSIQGPLERCTATLGSKGSHAGVWDKEHSRQLEVKCRQDQARMSEGHQGGQCGW